MKRLNFFASLLLLIVVLFSCSDSRVDEGMEQSTTGEMSLMARVGNNLTVEELEAIRLTGDRHNAVLELIYDSLSVNSNLGLDPRPSVYSFVAEYGNSVYSGDELELYVDVASVGESRVVQADSLNTLSGFTIALNESFADISDLVEDAGLNSLTFESYLNDLKQLMLDGYSSEIKLNLTNDLEGLFVLINEDEELTVEQKTILLVSIDVYEDSLEYWSTNLDVWYNTLNVQEGEAKISEPNINYTVIGAADAIGAIRGGVAGFYGGAAVGGVGAVPGALLGALSGAATGSALAAGAQILAWAWTSIWG